MSQGSGWELCPAQALLGESKHGVGRWPRLGGLGSPRTGARLFFQKSFQCSKLLVLSAQTLLWLQGLHPALLCSHS